MKRIISILLVLATLVGSGFTALAADEQASALSKKEMSRLSVLYHMGIIDSEEMKSDTMTRGELAKVLARLIGWGDYPAGDCGFTDVAADSEYASAVSAMYTLKAMLGISRTEFGVSEKVSVQNATVSIVRLLGYEGVAAGKGGYPEGHNAVAASLGLYKGIGMGKNSERAQILLMCYNALTAKYIDADGKVNAENILLEKAHNTYEIKGTITGNRFTTLGSSGAALAPDEIAIDGKKYYTDDTSLADYIGEYVTGWYCVRDDESYIISLSTDANKNNALTIRAQDIVSATGDEIKYENENNVKKKIRVATGFDFVVNNKLVADRTIADLDFEDGELTFIDNNNDGKYDVVKARKRETMVFQGADNLEDRIFCKEGVIYTNAFDDSYYSEVIKVDEKTGEHREISIDEISAGDVLTVYRSADSKYLQIFTYSKYLKGTIENIDNDEGKVVIDGKEYDLPLRSPSSELRLGDKTNFSLDMFGRLVYIDDTQNDRGPHYAFFFRYFEDEDGSYKMKLVTGDEIIYLPVADQVRLDNNTKYNKEDLRQCALFDGETPVRQLIKYKLNANGEIRDIYTIGGGSKDSIVRASDISRTTSTKYYQWERIWAGKYIHPEGNFFLVVPTVGNEPSDAELYSTQYSFGDDVNDVYVEIYDVNDKMEAGAVLIYSQDALDGEGKTGQNTRVGVICKKIRGEEDKIVLFDSGKKTEYVVNDRTIPSIDKYSPGDVVRYITGKDGRITTLYTVLDIGKTPFDTPLPTLTNDGYCHHYFARVKDKLDNYMVLIPNEGNRDFTDAPSKRVVVPTGRVRNCMLVDMTGDVPNVYEGSVSGVSKYYEGASGGVPCYVYVREYKFDTLFDLVIYKF